MDDHAGGFIDDHEVVVFVDDVEGDVFGDDFDFASGVCHDDGDDVPGFDFVAGFDGVSVHAYVSGVGGFLYFGA